MKTPSTPPSDAHLLQRAEQIYERLQERRAPEVVAVLVTGRGQGRDLEAMLGAALARSGRACMLVSPHRAEGETEGTAALALPPSRTGLHVLVRHDLVRAGTLPEEEVLEAFDVVLVEASHAKELPKETTAVLVLAGEWAAPRAAEEALGRTPPGTRKLVASIGGEVPEDEEALVLPSAHERARGGRTGLLIEQPQEYTQSYETLANALAKALRIPAPADPDGAAEEITEEGPATRAPAPKRVPASPNGSPRLELESWVARRYPLADPEVLATLVKDGAASSRIALVGAARAAALLAEGHGRHEHRRGRSSSET